MAKLILRRDDGKEIVLRNDAPEDGYFAMKLWSREDFEEAFIQNPDYDDVDFDSLCFYKDDLERLEEYTDNDREIVEHIIYTAVQTRKYIRDCTCGGEE